MTVILANYGQQRDLVCTEEERAVFNRIADMCSDLELPEPPKLVRVSDDYVSAKVGDWDLARIKYTNRAKWVIFPTAEAKSVKHRITSVDEVSGFQELVRKSAEIITKYC